MACRLRHRCKDTPVVIVSRYDPNAPSVLCIYIPLTTEDRDSSYEVPVIATFLREESVANVQGISSIAVARLERKLGVVSDHVLKTIREALKFALDLQ